MCIPCYLDRVSVINRSQLLSLSTFQLKYFANRRHIDTPLNVRREELVYLILTRQAKDLAQKTKLTFNHLNCLLEDLNRLMVVSPFVSAYSMVGGGARLASIILEVIQFGELQYMEPGISMTQREAEAPVSEDLLKPLN